MSCKSKLDLHKKETHVKRDNSDVILEKESLNKDSICSNRSDLDYIRFQSYNQSKIKKNIYLTSSVLCVLSGVGILSQHQNNQDESIDDKNVRLSKTSSKNKRVELVKDSDLKKESLKSDEEEIIEPIKAVSMEGIDGQENIDLTSNSELNINEEKDEDEYYLYNLEEQINPSNSESTISIEEPMTSDSVKNAMRYWNYFEYYGNTYGIDPYLLVAMACQESRGDHSTTIPGGKYYNGYGYGIMQIERPGIVTKKITAYNHVTKSYEIMYINTEDDVCDIGMNIKAGAMILSQKAKEQEYNPNVTIQGYNYGSSGIRYALSYYVANGDLNRIEEIYENGKGEHLVYYIAINNSDWVNNPTASGLTAREWYSTEGWKRFGAGRGDKNYIENVMRFYIGSDNPYILKDTGEKVIF